MNIVNVPDPHLSDGRIVGFRIEKGDEAFGEHGLSEACTWFQKRLSAGIKEHDGQKIVIQYILDTDSGINDYSRRILEDLIS
jgi:hypothetical protein